MFTRTCRLFSIVVTSSKYVGNFGHRSKGTCKLRNGKKRKETERKKKRKENKEKSNEKKRKKTKRKKTKTK